MLLRNSLTMHPGDSTLCPAILSPRSACHQLPHRWWGLTSNEDVRGSVSVTCVLSGDIRSEFEKYGNWEVVTEETSTGASRYFLEDIHPGQRTYGYRPMYTRHALSELSLSPTCTFGCGVFHINISTLKNKDDDRKFGVKKNRPRSRPMSKHNEAKGT